MALIKCPECGKEISDKATACPNCGYPIDGKPIEPVETSEPVVEADPVATDSAENIVEAEPCAEEKKAPDLAEEYPVPQAPAPAAKQERSRTSIVIAIIAAAVLVIAAILISGAVRDAMEKKAEEAAKPDFSKLAESAPTDGTVSVSDDGLSMTVDTNPLDISKYNSSEAITFIKDVNAELGLPDSLYEKMVATRALDGRQTSDYDHVEVSWSYHPDNGLEVIYESE